MKLLITDTFPTIEVTTTQGEITLPDEYAGHWFVFFSHPRDFTPVCATEFVGFQKRAEQFAALDTKLVGLSVDDIGQHHAWIPDHLEVGVEFPIVDDEDWLISLELGMLRADQAESVTARSVIVIDPHGVMRTILEYPKEMGCNLDEIVRIVKGLQLFDSSNLMTPANWANNENMGDLVLVPPSMELTAAQVAEQHVTQLSDWFRYHRASA